MKKHPMKVSVILPSYNEKENLLALIPRIRRALADTYIPEIIVVDDASPDGTASALIRRFGNTITVAVRKNTRGLGTAILYGVRQASGNILIGMDADGNHDPRFIPSLLRGLRDADLVIGSRFLPGGGMRNPFRFGASYWFNRWASLLGFPVTDATSGYYAIRRSALNTLPLTTIYRGYGEYHLRLVWYAKQYAVLMKEVPVYYGSRRYGQSKSQFLIMLGTYIHTVLRLVRS